MLLGHLHHCGAHVLEERGRVVVRRIGVEILAMRRDERDLKRCRYVDLRAATGDEVVKLWLGESGAAVEDHRDVEFVDKLAHALGSQLWLRGIEPVGRANRWGEAVDTRLSDKLDGNLRRMNGFLIRTDAILYARTVSISPSTCAPYPVASATTSFVWCVFSSTARCEASNSTEFHPVARHVEIQLRSGQ